jgi:hypothetical protein
MRSGVLLLSTAFLLNLFQSVNGQAGCNCKVTEDLSSGLSLAGEIVSSALQADSVTYLNNGWLPADLYLTNGDIIRKSYIKYNGLLDELYWLEPVTKKVIKLDKEEISRFHYVKFKSDTTVWFRKIKVRKNIGSDSANVFAQEIYSGKLSLFILHSFVMEGHEVSARNGAYYQKTIYSEAPVYYFRFLNKKTVGLKKLNRKSIYSIVPDKKDQIRKFFSEKGNKRFKNNSDLVRLAEFLSSVIYQ